VLHVIPGLATGGAETALEQIAAGLAARGLPQHVVIMRSAPGDEANRTRLAAAGVPVTLVPLASATLAPAGLLALVRLARRLRPRAVQGWLYYGDLAATVAALAAPGARLFRGIRCSALEFERYRSGLRLAPRLCAGLSRRPDAVIANSEAGLAAHVAAGYRPRAARVIANGIDSPRFRPDPEARSAVRASLGLPPDRVVAIHVARVPRVAALLVGAGTEALTLPRDARALGRRDDVPRLLAAADIVVSSSAFGEGFPNVVPEGLTAGLPAIATDVGDARAIVGDTGLVVPPRDVVALAAALETLAAEPEADRRRRGAAARARIVKRVTLERAVDAFAALYVEG
jgi:glycosyltransferase involved in cell wall biosynthesis